MQRDCDLAAQTALDWPTTKSGRAGELAYLVAIMLQMATRWNGNNLYRQQPNMAAQLTFGFLCSPCLRHQFAADQSSRVLSSKVVAIALLLVVVVVVVQMRQV